MGCPDYPYLQQTSSILNTCSYDNRQLNMELEAYPGHRNESCIITPYEPKDVLINGKQVTKNIFIESFDGYYKLVLWFTHSNYINKLGIKF